MQELEAVSETNCRRAIMAIVKYCADCNSHSALSTVAMLAVDALEAYDTESAQFKEVMEELFTAAESQENGP